LFLLLFVIQTQAQQGGMWIPLIERNEWNRNEESRHENVNKDIYDVNQSSMKDVPHFNGGCTWSDFAKGLLLTNHHCGYSQIQSHSSVDKDYLADGFGPIKWKTNYQTKVWLLLYGKIEDVTTQILEGTAHTKRGWQTKKIQENITRLSLLPKESWQENKIRTFYEGNHLLL
jgi:hypothetical protein